MQKPTVCVLSGLFLVTLLEGIHGCGPSVRSQDQSDRSRLGEIFGIPGECELVSYDGYPASVGFGQREGLSISAVFSMTEEQGAVFVDNNLEAGWRRLPMPDSVVAKIPFVDLPVPLEAARGIYTCRTAGDNVLHAASTIPVEEAEHVNDIILGVFDLESGLLHVVVRSAY